MGYKVLAGTYVAAGYALSPTYQGLIIQSDASVGGKGVSASASATIFNAGGINANSLYSGVYLSAGGYVQNGQNATIRGAQGVDIQGASGSVTNYGLVVGTIGVGVELGYGGVVVNGSAQYTSAYIRGLGYWGIEIGGAAAITNYGLISGGHFGVVIGGGNVTNGTAEDTTATIRGGIYGVYAGSSATVTNLAGTIQGRANTGVYLENGGAVTNGGFTSTAAMIVGKRHGVMAKHAAATVVNYGLIQATGSNYADIGVYLASGGKVINGGPTDRGARIAGYYGVGGSTTAASVFNYGTISGFGPTAAGVKLHGSVTNGALGDTTALIEGASGVEEVGGSIVNLGSIIGDRGSAVAIQLTASAQVTNGAPTDTAALIRGAIFGLYSTGAGTVTNYGLIEGGSKQGVYIGGGGRVTNGSRADTVARIEGYAGVAIYNAAGTVANYGTIAAAGPLGHPAVNLKAGGSLTNGFNSDTTALLQGVTGVDMGGAGTVTNFAVIDGLSGYGVVLRAGGTIINGGGVDHAARITGYIGVKGAGVVRNFGTVLSTSASHFGVYLSGGTLSNGSVNDTTALIEGYSGAHLQGVYVSRNLGTIWGAGDAGGQGVMIYGGASLTNGAASDSKALVVGYTGVTVSGTGTLTNFGTIEGVGGVAVAFGAAADTLVVEAGSTFIGKVMGGAGTLVLANGAGKITNLFAAAGATVSGSMAPTLFQAFNKLTVSGGASFTDADAATTIAGGDRIIDQGTLALSGAVANAGQISVTGGRLLVGAAGLSLTGVGMVVLSNSAANQILGASGASTLTLGQRLSGAGNLGVGQMTLQVLAAGSIVANASLALTIDTGANTIANAGIISATGSGGLVINSAIANGGSLVATSGTLAVNGAVSGAGAGHIGAGLLKFTTSSVFNQNVVYLAGATGTLELAHGQTYAGTLFGFSTTAQTFLDLDDIAYSAATTTESYVGTAASGVLTVSDGTHTAKIKFNGNYTTSTWVLASDGHGGTKITDPPAAAKPIPPGPAVHSPFVQAMAAFTGPAATYTAVPRYALAAHPLLAAPRSPASA